MAEFGLYSQTNCREMNYELYFPKTPPTDFYTQSLKFFQTYLHQRKSDWDRILAVQLPARVDSHPTLKQRMENLNCDSFDDTAKESDPAYLEDCRKLTEEANRLFEKDISPNYNEIRDNVFVDRNKAMENYYNAEKNGRPLSLEKSVQSAEAFLGVRDDVAETILEGVFRTAPEHAYARFLKGNLLYQRMNPACVEEFRSAIHFNRYLTETCLDFIGQYAIYSGNTSLLEELREQTPDLMQKVSDHVKRTKWKGHLPLRKTALSEELKELKSDLTELTKNIALRIFAADYTADGKTMHLLILRAPKEFPRAYLKQLTRQLQDFLNIRADSWNVCTYANPIVRRAVKKAKIEPFLSTLEFL